MQLTIELPDFFPGDAANGIRGASLQDLIVEAAAQQVLAGAREDVGGYRKGLRERIAAIQDEHIRAAVLPDIEAALTRAVQPTDHYGQPKGEPVTLHEVITEKAMSWLTTPASERYGESRMTPVERLIKEEVERAFAREVKAALDEAKQQVKDAVQQQGARVLAETITRMAGAS